MLELTKDFLTCRLCPDDFGTGNGILPGLPPRGWAGAPEPGPRPIVVASLNPGHPIPGEIDVLRAVGLYPREEGSSVTDAAAGAALRFCTDFYDTRERSRDHIYARVVIGYIRATAWLLRRADPSVSFDPASSPWQAFAWITDTFKCSTRNDSGPRIPASLMQECVRRHLSRELAACKARIVLALGNAASQALSVTGIPHVKIRHAANGAPRLPSTALDASFADIAERLGLPSSVGASDEFREFRRRVYSRSFGRPADGRTGP